MTFELINRSVTIVAQQFSPSIFSQLWLVKHQLIGEEEFEPTSFFSQNLVQVAAKRFTLIVFPQQLQWSPLVDQDAEGLLVSSTICRITELLPETPYTAIGMNFIWQVVPAGETVREFSRRLFGRTDSAIYHRFRDEDALFGAYMSKGFRAWRMNLDIRPIVIDGSKEDRLQLACNFHLDLTGTAEAPAAIAGAITAWDEARSEALQVVESLQVGT
jgi:hypothetical protein